MRTAALELMGPRVVLGAAEDLAIAGLEESLPGAHVIARVAPATVEALERPAGVIVWDVGSGLRALHTLSSSACPALAVAPDEGVATALIGSGIRGLLLRDGAPAAFLPAARAVAAGLVILDLALARHVRPLPVAGEAGW